MFGTWNNKVHLEVSPICAPSQFSPMGETLYLCLTINPCQNTAEINHLNTDNEETPLHLKLS